MNQRNLKFILFNKTINEFSFRGIWYIVAVYLGAILFAAIFSPLVYWGVQVWHANFPNSLNNYLAHKGIDLYFDRLRWIPLLLGLSWLMKLCKLSSLQALGIVFNKQESKLLLRGLLLAFLIVALFVLGEYSVISVHLKSNLWASSYTNIILSSLLSGLILGILEETIFRGFVLRLFYTAFRPLTALVLCSLFFAYTHFKIPDDIVATSIQDVQWYSGFIIASWTLIGIAHSFQFFTFINLFLLGMALGLFTLKTKTLMQSIGFHTGIVWFIFCYKKLFIINGVNAFFGGRGNFTDAPFITVMLLLLVCSFLWKRHTEV